MIDFSQTALWWASEEEPDCGAGINWCEFAKDLDIGAEENATEWGENVEVQLAPKEN